MKNEERRRGRTMENAGKRATKCLSRWWGLGVEGEGEKMGGKVRESRRMMKGKSQRKAKGKTVKVGGELTDGLTDGLMADG